MRIIAGTAGRRNIKVPKAVARPTTDRTREALFSMLATYVPNAKVLDLFAGSGALGLEALSRGAAQCTFVDQDRGSVATIKQNLTALSLSGGSVLSTDVFTFLSRSKGTSYDLIFADPPYYKNPGDTDFIAKLLALDALPSLLTDQGLLIIEAPANQHLTLPTTLELIDSRKYGGCGIFFIQTSPQS